MNINRNQKYYAIVFDWDFKTQSKIVPSELGKMFENFNKVLGEKYIKFSKDIFIPKTNADNIVSTIVEFSKILTIFKPLINIMNISQAEVIKIEANGSVLDLLK